MKSGDVFIVTKDENNEYNLIEESILQRYATKTSTDHKTQSKQLKPDEYSQFKQPAYDFNSLCELLENNTVHARCCEVVGQDSGGYGWNITPTADLNEDPNTDLKDQITNWIKNFKTDINTTLKEVGTDRRALGSGVIELIRENTSESHIVDLEHVDLHNGTLLKHTDECRVRQQVGTQTQWFILYGMNHDENGTPYDVNRWTGEKVPYNTLSNKDRANELIWMRDYAPHMNEYGFAKVIPAIRAIYGDIGRSEYNIKFYENYGMPTFAAIVTGDFQDYEVDPEDPEYDPTQTLKYQLGQQLQEVVKNPHSALTIVAPSVGSEGNVKVELVPLSVDTKEASFRLYREDNQEEVLLAHGVPPYRIGKAIEGSLGGSVARETTQIYNVSVIQPLKCENEAIMDMLIYDEFNTTMWSFKIDELDNRSIDQDLENAMKLFLMGGITPRQLIERFGKSFGAVADENNPYLDMYFVNNTPIDVLCMNVQQANNDKFFNDLEQSLLDEAEQLDNNGDGGNFGNGNGNGENKDNIDGFEVVANKSAVNPVEQAIQRAFSLRRTA